MDPMTLLAIGGFALNLTQGVSSYANARSQRKIQKREAKANINILEDYLERFPEYEELATDQYEEQGRQRYRELMGNLGATNVRAGYTGQAGKGSAALVGAEQRGDVERYVGEDLALGGGDGMYGKGYSVLKGNLAGQKYQAEQQLKVWKKTKNEASKNFFERLF